jgi:release factor glutamine methyltransferase
VAARPSIADVLREATSRLAADSDTPRLDVELLLAHALGVPRERLVIDAGSELTPSQLIAFDALLSRREAREPVAYILGRKEFRRITLSVDSRVLIPRPETELLVDIGRAAVAAGLSRVVEVGTGSGAVAISLAAETGGRVVATDLSFEALALARENASRLGQTERVSFVQSDLLGGLRGPFEVVLANLPYIPRGRILPPDVANYEPEVALYAGSSGTELLEQVLRQALALLAERFQVALELDECDQARPMLAVAQTLYPTAEVTIRRDAGGYERVLLIEQASR